MERKAIDENTNKDPTADDERFAAGTRMLNRVNGDAGAHVLSSLHNVYPGLGYYIVAWGFGGIYSREELRPRGRQLVTSGMLTAPGGCKPQLEVHVGTVPSVGPSPREIVETILHASAYYGSPRSLSAVFVTKCIFSEQGLLPPAD